MSAENVAVVRGMFERAEARDWGPVLDAHADDVTLHLHGADLPTLGGDQAIGKRAYSEWFSDWFGTFDTDYRFELEDVRDWGERVFIVGTHFGKGRASGAPIRQRTVWLYTLRDRKIVRCDVYTDPEAALRAAGMS